MLFDGESVYLYNRESLTKRCGMDCSEIEYNIVIRVKLHRSWIDWSTVCLVTLKKHACTCVQYAYYGTSVVKACIEAGTHHIDICGEPGVSSCHCKFMFTCSW